MHLRIDWEAADSMIYAIKFGFLGWLKFGVSDNPVARLATLQVAAPVDLEILASADWPDEFEGFVHEYLRQTRLRGEWFNESERASQVISIMQSKAGKDSAKDFLALIVPHLQEAISTETERKEEASILRRRAERVAWWMGRTDAQPSRAGFVWDAEARRWVKSSRSERLVTLLGLAIGTANAA